MRLYKFGTALLPIFNAEDSIPVSARSALITMMNGGIDQDGDRLILQPVRVSHRCEIMYDGVTSIDTQVDTLLKEVGRGRRLLKAAYRDDLTFRQTWAKMVGVQRENKPGDLGHQPLVIEFEIDRPMWIATDDEPVYLDHGYVLDSGWNLDAGHKETRTITSSPHTFTITNGGGLQVLRGGLAVIPRAASSITDLKVENLSNGHWLKLTGTIAATERLDVDFLSKSIRLDGEDAYSGFSIDAKQLDWMRLELGDNSIKVTGTVVGTVDFYWFWSRHYL